MWAEPLPSLCPVQGLTCGHRLVQGREGPDTKGLVMLLRGTPQCPLPVTLCTEHFNWVPAGVCRQPSEGGRREVGNFTGEAAAHPGGKEGTQGGEPGHLLVRWAAAGCLCWGRGGWALPGSAQARGGSKGPECGGTRAAAGQGWGDGLPREGPAEEENHFSRLASPGRAFLPRPVPKQPQETGSYIKTVFARKELHLFIHSFTQQALTEHLSHPSHCVRCWEYKGEAQSGRADRHLNRWS